MPSSRPPCTDSDAAQSPAELEPYGGRNQLSDAPHDREVVTGAERAIQVDDVYPAGALLDEALGDRDGVVSINGLPRRLALAQANDAAVSNVDGGKEIHYCGATAATGLWFQPLAGRSHRAEPGRRRVGGEG